MKVKNVLILSLFLFVSPFTLFAQSDSLGMLGDQLDLYGVLDLFKNSDNLEEFEKKLNSEDNEVNNLDLNNDDQIDYIRVIDYKDGNGHAIVLQVPISDTESQDVAVIELDNTADGQAHIQIVGDEDLYGKNYIVEPLDDNHSVTNNTTVVVNVWTWRPVRYFYGPHYRAWVSPWRWSYYPGWFRPWRPLGWHAYHPRIMRYHTYGRVVVVRRSPRIYTTVYAPRRVTSKVVITNGAPRSNYYNKQNKGQNANQGRQNANQGPNKTQNGSDGGRNYNEGRQKKTQDNAQNLNQGQNKEQVNPDKKQREERKQGTGVKQQRVKGEGRNQQRHAGGKGGGGGRRK
ncbi:MAG: hypothetical protein H7282_06560 [Cytophagaceae bacterium]|nr:hypothetical protein [Cytophagaceae bacterium]